MLISRLHTAHLTSPRFGDSRGSQPSYTQDGDYIGNNNGHTYTADGDIVVTRPNGVKETLFGPITEAAGETR